MMSLCWGVCLRGAGEDDGEGTTAPALALSRDGGVRYDRHASIKRLTSCGLFGGRDLEGAQ